MKPSTSRLPALAALLLLSTSLASAKDVEWNQERVAALAHELDAPLQVFRADLEAHPAPPGKEAARAAMMNDIERLQQKAQELARRLAGGAGRADTLSLFHEVEALERQAAKTTQSYPPPGFDTHRYVDQLDGTTNELRRYYGEYKAPGDRSKE